MRNWKRVIYMAVCVAMLLGCFLAVGVPAQAATWTGSGTASSPYLISTQQNLRDLATKVNAGNSYSGVHFKLASDITLTSAWTPIGTETYKFRGTFDGNGKTISGMTATGSYSGLFAYIGSGAVIKNVNLMEFSVEGPDYIAGLVAYADAGTGSITISGCSVDGELRDNLDSFADGYVAGIVGYANAESGAITISGCTAAGDNYCDYNSGGIVGYGKGNNKSLKIMECTNNAYIGAGNNGDACGGIAGYLGSAEVVKCANYGSVSGNAYSEDNGSSWLGGIAGSSYDTTYTACANYGTVYTFFAGGITATQNSGNVANYCLNVGKLTHSSDGSGSALLYTGTVSNSYYLYGSGIAGSYYASSSKMASGAVAHALGQYYGQVVGVDPYPVLLTDSNRVYKVTVAGETSGTYYVNYGQTVTLPELSSCAAYFNGEEKFDTTTPITRDYALAAKGYHSYVDGLCEYCGQEESSGYVDVGSCGQSIVWKLSAGGVLTISGSGAMEDFTASNPAPWQAYSDSITSVVVEDGVTTLGDYAFKGLSNVTSLTITDTVTSYGDYAFAGITGLTSFTVSDSVTSIGDYAFSGCTGLNRLTLGKQVQTIGDYAFTSCTALQSIHIPTSVTTLGDGVFQNCTLMSYISMDSGLKSIGASAFSGTAVSYLIIPQNVETIGANAFANCPSLTEVTFRGAAPTIASTAFSGMTVACHVPNYDSSWASNVQKNFGGTLTWARGSGTCGYSVNWVLDFTGKLTISGTGDMYAYYASWGETSAPWVDLCDKILAVEVCDGVTSIGDYAFFGCSNLTDVSIADSVTKIGREYDYVSSSYGSTFMDCTSLTQITIPKNVKEIGYDTFYGCSSLTTINVASGNTAYSSADGVLYDRYKYALHCYPAGKTGSFTIPSTVDEIMPYAFATNENLAEITIPSGVTELGNYAFGYCEGLTEITFAGSAPTISNYAFTSVTANVDIPAANTTWTTDLLKNYGGTLTWNAGSGDCGTGVWWKVTYVGGSATLTIGGSGAMSDYTSSTIPWKAHLTNIKTVEIQNGVTSIGAYALCDATSLTTVTMANTVTSIGNYAFEGTSSLRSITLSSGVKTIGDYAFMNTGLYSITFPDSVTSIGINAFSYSTSLQTVIMGAGVRTISNYAFSGCSALKTLNLGAGVQTIGNYAFSTGSMTKLVIPASVTSLGTHAFHNCTNLQYVEFLGNAPTINTNAFYGVTCNAYYLSGKSGWTSSKLANYGGTITWGVIAQRGSCGSNAEWILDTAGNLFICGSGAMNSYSEAYPAPWNAYKASIKTVNVRGVTSIGSYAFADCTALQVVIFDGNGPSIGTNAFSGVTCEAWYLSTASSWTSSKLVNYGGTLTWRKITAKGVCGTTARWGLDSNGNLVIQGAGAMNSYSSVSSQPWYSNRSSITAVIVGDKITSVGDRAFYSLPALQTVTVGKSVTSIGSYAFAYGGDDLSTITFMGNAPTFTSNSFLSTTATAQYQMADTTWTTSKKQNYGGTITWEAVCLTHNVAVAAAVEPTCTTTGLTEGQYCTICDAVLVAQEVIPANGHYVIGPEGTEVPADSLEPDCTTEYLCTVCNKVGLAAAGHRILGTVPVEADPLTITNTSTYPFSLSNGKYTSTNKANKSSSSLVITAKHDCTLTLIYGVSSEAGWDELTILLNGSEKDCISGEEDNLTMTLTLKAGDKVTVRYKKDESQKAGSDKGWVTLEYDLVMVDGIGDVPAETGEPDCTNAVVCRYCDTVLKEALGHRVILRSEEPEDACVLDNTSTYPFTNEAGIFYSGNKGKVSSTSELVIRINAAGTLTLNYGVSSEPTHDKLTILRNGTQVDQISGVVDGKMWTQAVTAGDVVTVRYTKDSSVNKNDDRGWVLVIYEIEVNEQIVPADTVAADCDGVTCDFCDTLVKEGLGHDWLAATCIAIESCSRCDATQGEIDPNGHSFADGVCTLCGIIGGQCGDTLYWSLDSGVLTIYGTGAMYDYDLTSNMPWYAYRQTITSLVMEGGTTIGYNAFNGLSALQSVTLSQELLHIRSNAFSGCSSLTSVTIPDSVTIIWSWAFENCTSLEYVTIGENVTTIQQAAFYRCSALKSVRIPNGVTQLQFITFDGCTSLESVAIPASVTSIGEHVFNNCTALTDVYFGGTEEAWTVLGENAPVADYIHYEISSPTGHWYTTTVEPDCESAGYTCEACLCGYEKNVRDEKAALDHTGGEATCTEQAVCTRCNEAYGESLGHAWTDADCDTAKTCSRCGVTEGEKLDHVWDPATCEAPKTCSLCGATEGEKLGHDWLDATCITVKSCDRCGATQGETDLRNHNFSEGKCLWCDRFGGMCGDSLYWLMEDDDSLIIYGSGAMEDYASGGSAPWYTHRNAITDVTVEGGSSIGDYAFYNLKNAQTVSVADSVNSIGRYAFYACTKMIAVDLPDTMAEIGTNAFQDCRALTSVSIPNGVSVVMQETFLDCTALTTVSLPDSVTEIRFNAFQGCGKLADITLPENLTRIAENVFRDCTSLTTIQIPAGVDAISFYTFAGCTALETVVISGDLNSIDTCAFEGCTALKSINIPDSVTSLGVQAFAKCSSLTNIELPDDLISMGSSVFAYCSGLTSIKIPEGVDEIPDYAFGYCTGLTSVTIPETVTSIGSEAFVSCSGLEDVYFGGTEEAWTALGENAPVATYIHYEIDNPTGHWYVTTIDPTCTEAGYTCDACICGYEKNIRDEQAALEHTGGEATCTELAVCTRCGESYGEELGHEWIPADCEDPKTCDRCGTTEGESAGHTWIEAGCTYPKTCNDCGITEGESLGHSWTDADCENPKTCETCGATEGEELGHSWNDADCENPKTCETCGATEGEELGHDWIEADCENAKRCNRCDTPAGEALGHIWTDADCENPKTCTRCGATEGEKLGHSWLFADCENPDICDRCGATQGEPLGHAWKKATCVAPETCSRCSATQGEIVARGHIFVNGTCTECDIAGGKCGENLYWTYNSGVVTVYGTGDMYNYQADTIPWNSYINSITAVVLEEGVTSVGDFAFMNTALLKNVTIPGNVKSIGSFAFSGSGIQHVIIQKGVERIEGNAFAQCYNLEIVALNDGLTSINTQAFYDCDKLWHIVIPATVTEFGDDIFDDCEKMEDVYYGGTEAQWPDGRNMPYGRAHYNAPSSDGHWIWNKTLSPTCESGGYTCDTCPCGYEINIRNQVGALGHTGGEATCTDQAICTRCGEGYGAMLDHTWIEAGCTYPKTCNDCGITEGEPLDHDWQAATCYAPQTCSRCYTTQGQKLPHTGGTATCNQQAICANCGNPYGELADHSWQAATCTAPESCKNCSTTRGTSLGHTGGTATCAEQATCDRCGEGYGQVSGDHNWLAATCIAPEMCDRCGATRGEKIAHFGGEATCTELAICTGCLKPYGALKAHSFDANWRSDKSGHWHACTACGAKDSVKSHNPGPAATADKAQTCTDCGYEIAPKLDHAHKLTLVPYSAPKCEEDGNIAYYTCDCGQWFLEAYAQTPIADHSTVKLPATGHSHVKTETVAAKCEAGGYSVYTCACGDNYEADHVSALGHTGGTASCTSQPRCTRCGNLYGEKLDHVFDFEGPWLPGDTTGHWHECIHCGTHEPPIPHIPGPEATEETAQTCTECGYVITPALGHTHKLTHKAVVEPTCDKPGAKEYFECTCGKWFADGEAINEITDHSTMEIPAKGHSHSQTVTTPTCTADGYTTYTCACGDSYVADIVPTPGHSYEEGTCGECGAVDESYVPKFSIAFANMTLGNSLDMNFAFQQDHREDWTGCYAMIVKEYADGRPNKVVNIPYAQWGSATISGVKHFALKFDGVAAKEMSDNVYVTIYAADGTAISDTWKDSVRDYAMRTLNNPKTSEESFIMVVDLLNYGAAAQSYFKYNTGDLANNQMTEEQKAKATKVAEATDIRVKGDNYKGTNLSLDNQIILQLAFANVTRDMYATVEFTNHVGRDISVTVPGSEFIEKGSVYGVAVDEIAVADGRKPVTVTVYNVDGTVHGSAVDSMASYITRMADAHPLFECILKFSDSAYNFFH